MSLRSPLSRVIGYGSARGGTEHWWSQRVTAVALVPLTLWFVFSLVALGSLELDAVRGWAGSPVNAVLNILLLISLLYHSQLGLQVVVEDYVHGHWLKVASLILLRFAHVGLGVAAIYALITISAGVRI